MSVFLLAVFFDQKLAFADQATKSGNLVKGTSEAGHEYDLTEFLKMAENVYDIVVKIAIPCAAVSLALAGLRMLFGTSEELSRAKSQIIITLVAIASILLIPPFVYMGVQMGSNHAWQPTITNDKSLQTKVDQETLDRHKDDKTEEGDKDKDKDKGQNTDKEQDKDKTEDKE